MSEIVNLRRVRKAKARAVATALAEANRAKHGVSKSVRDLAKTRTEKLRREAEAGKLDPKP